MHVLSATGLSKSYDGRVLFTDLALGVQTGERIGLVGPNGSGKSTLLKILSGTVEPDAGEVVPATGARIRMLAQQPELPRGTATAAVLDGADAATRQHEAEALLDKLGIDPGAEVSEMSGGQKRRVALATALVAPADLLILDEPTNHLDVWTVDWLEDELRSRTSALLLVTHDRRMLERLTTKLLELDPRGLDPTGTDGPGDGRRATSPGEAGRAGGAAAGAAAARAATAVVARASAARTASATGDRRARAEARSGRRRPERVVDRTLASPTFRDSCARAPRQMPSGASTATMARSGSLSRFPRVWPRAVPARRAERTGPYRCACCASRRA